MQHIVYTTHARQRMAFRGITETMVEEAIIEPDETGIGYRSRQLAYLSFPQGRMKVVYVNKPEAIVVITVMWER